MAYPRPEEILSPDHRNTLSISAIKLYCAVIHKINLIGKAEMATTNGQLLSMCRLRDEQFFGSQQEIDEAGLLHITYDHRPGFVFSAQRAVYRLPDSE